MIGSTRELSVYVFHKPVDMRKQYDTLMALVTQQLRRDVLAGGIYLFVGKDRKRAKVLHWDGTGLCVFAKRLEKGRFAAVWASNSTQSSMTMTTSELSLFLEGSELVGKYRLSPEALVIDRALCA